MEERMPEDTMVFKDMGKLSINLDKDDWREGQERWARAISGNSDTFRQVVNSQYNSLPLDCPCDHVPECLLAIQQFSPELIMQNYTHDQMATAST
jgi:hypothetical protein